MQITEDAVPDFEEENGFSRRNLQNIRLQYRNDSSLTHTYNHITSINDGGYTYTS